MPDLKGIPIQSQITVEVAYARPDKQMILTLRVDPGTSLIEAARRSGICDHFPEIDLESARMGVFGKLGKPEDPLVEGDRVEIYRPLIADPKAARRKKAAAEKAAD